MSTLGRSGPGWWMRARMHDVHLAVCVITIGAVAVACSFLDRRTAADSARLTEPAAAAQGLAQLAAADSLLERDRWDPGAVVAQVGKDPGRLFGWVSRNTQWIPYRGILRGASGVLNDRLGNQLDRSLLLAILLQRAGYRVRLAHAELAPTQVAALLPRIAAEQVVRAAKQAPFRYDRAAVQDIAYSAGPYAGPVGKVLLAVGDTLGRAAAELSRRVEDQSARLLRAVPRADTLARLWSWYAGARTALADQWWVQRDSSGTWIDMDLLAGGGAPVASQDGAVETVSLDSLPARGPYQEIGVRVVAEYRDGAKLTEKRLLDYALRPVDVLGQPIVLQFWPARWFTDSVARREMSQRPLADIPDEHEFGAMLVVGDRTVAAAGFRDSGEGEVEKAAAEAGPMGGLAGGLSSALGVKQRRAPDLTAVWLEYEFRVPGDSARTVRREVFDLIGPAARAGGRVPSTPLDSTQQRARALALTMRTELVPVSCRLAGAFVNQLAAQGLRDNARLLGTPGHGFEVKRRTPEELALEAAPLPSPLLTLAVARLAWSPYAHDIYVDRAGLLTRHVSLVTLGGRLGLRDAVDIVANDVGVGPMAQNRFAVRLSQGVFDTNAEALLWASPGAGNVGDAYAASTSWRVIPPDGGGAVGGLPVPEDVQQRVRADVAAGNIVVAPTTEVRVHGQSFAGWWRVDRVTGATLGMGANGWGVQGTENSALVRQRITWSQYFIEMARLAAPRFTHAFGTTLVICMAFTAGEDASAGKSLEAHAEVAHSFTECVGDSFVIAALATVPLLMITMDEMAAIRAARLAGGSIAVADGMGKAVPENSKPLPSEQKPPELGSKKPPPPEQKPPEPGSQKSPPPEQKPPEEPPDRPDLAKTQPQTGQPPDVPEKQPQAEPTPDPKSPLAKSLPPGAEPQPDPKSPLATTQPPDPSMEKTLPQPEAGGDPEQANAKPQPAPDDGQPVDKSELTPGRQRLLDMEQQLIEANEDYLAKQQSAADATGEYIEYDQNNPNDPRRVGRADPSKWDPETSQQLDQKSLETLKDMNQASDAVDEQLDKVNLERIKYRVRSLNRADIPTSPRPGQFIGCPPNCGTLLK